MIRRIALLGAAVALTLGAPATAQAAVLNLVDDRGDVYKAVGDARPEHAVGERRTDIVRTHIRHTARAFVVRTKLVDLRRERGDGEGLVMRMRTNDGLYRVVGVVASRSIGWRGFFDMTRRDGTSVECAASHEFNYERDYISVRIPSSCLSDPRWVQSTVVSFLEQGRTSLSDTPHNNTARFNVWTPRVRRG
jgi:hypothetical protein